MKGIFAFISGATSGFGEAIARKFAENGLNIIITGRRQDRLEALKQELILKHPTIECVISCFDVRNEDEVKNAVLDLPDHVTSKIYILVNNAGLAVGRGPIDTGDSDDWNRMIDTNVKGLLYVSMAIIPFLKNHRNSQIVNIASIAGKEVYPGGNVYCASKHAVDALSRAMRMDLLPYGIKVTNIAPGAADTEFSLVRFKGDSETAKSVYEGYTPLYAEDIADSVFYVCSRPAHVTINDLVIMPTAQASATNLLKD
ncbi:MAG: SDR family NAD(P)-dependent oxidoreductase [Crocinitomicaceae bacterium]